MLRKDSGLFHVFVKLPPVGAAPVQAATGPGGVKVRKRDKADIFQDLVSTERGILAPLLHVTRIMKILVQSNQRGTGTDND